MDPVELISSNISNDTSKNDLKPRKKTAYVVWKLCVHIAYVPKFLRILDFRRVYEVLFIKALKRKWDEYEKDWLAQDIEEGQRHRRFKPKFRVLKK